MWNHFETAPERYRRQTSCSWHIANRLYRIDGWLIWWTRRSKEVTVTLLGVLIVSKY